ncbi:polypyrimidine tract-binding protein homolog 3 isoform X1 [Tanacetum coccineum]
MASGGSYQNAKDTLSKLLQMGTVAEYQNEFEILINRVTRIYESLLKSFYISVHKLALQLELLRSKPTTLEEAFSLALLHQVFSPHGYVEKVVTFQKSVVFQAFIQFQSRQNAIAARNSLHGHNIYEGCCQLDMKFSNLEELQVNHDDKCYWEIVSRL